jgi:hypothetical protein
VATSFTGRQHAACFFLRGRREPARRLLHGLLERLHLGRLPLRLVELRISALTHFRSPASSVLAAAGALHGRDGGDLAADLAGDVRPRVHVHVVVAAEQLRDLVGGQRGGRAREGRVAGLVEREEDVARDAGCAFVNVRRQGGPAQIRDGDA